MSTTLFPLANGGPFPEEEVITFPEITGRGMGHTILRESLSGKSAKKFIKAAEGHVGGKKPKVKKSSKPKNLKASGKKKRGVFGEVYSAPSGSKGKGIRVSESG